MFETEENLIKEDTKADRVEIYNYNRELAGGNLHSIIINIDYISGLNDYSLQFDEYDESLVITTGNATLLKLKDLIKIQELCKFIAKTCISKILKWEKENKCKMNINRTGLEYMKNQIN